MVLLEVKAFRFVFPRACLPSPITYTGEKGNQKPNAAEWHFQTLHSPRCLYGTITEPQPLFPAAAPAVWRENKGPILENAERPQKWQSFHGINEARRIAPIRCCVFLYLASGWAGIIAGLPQVSTGSQFDRMDYALAGTFYSDSIQRGQAQQLSFV